MIAPLFPPTGNKSKLEKLLAALVRNTREQTGRTSEPSYGIIDSQSVKTTGSAQERGIDGGKKQKDTSVIL